MTVQPMPPREFSPPSSWLSIKRQLKNLALTVPRLRARLLLARIHLDNALYSAEGFERSVKKIRAPLCTATDGAPSFQAQSTPGMPRALVLSIPKSGTHLLHAVLAELGLAPTNVFINESAFDDQRFLEGTEMVLDQRRKIPCPLALSAELVRPGQFALSHLICDDAVRAPFKDYRLLFICRELRNMHVSNMRWRMKEGHGDEFGVAWKKEPDDKRRMEKFMQLYAGAIANTNREIALWRNDASVLQTKFETLCGDEGMEAQRALVKKIMAHIGQQPDDARADEVISRALGAHTKTWSGGRSVLEHYWTDRCEELFRRHGGPEMNRSLGYS